MAHHLNPLSGQSSWRGHDRDRRGKSQLICNYNHEEMYQKCAKRDHSFSRFEEQSQIKERASNRRVEYLTSHIEDKKYAYGHSNDRRRSTSRDHFLSTQQRRAQFGDLNMFSDPSQKQIESLEDLPNAVHSNSLRTGGGLSTDRSPGLVQYNNWYVARQLGNGINSRVETQQRES